VNENLPALLCKILEDEKELFGPLVKREIWRKFLSVGEHRFQEVVVQTLHHFEPFFRPLKLNAKLTDDVIVRKTFASEKSLRQFFDERVADVCPAVGDSDLEEDLLKAVTEKFGELITDRWCIFPERRPRCRQK